MKKYCTSHKNAIIIKDATMYDTPDNTGTEQYRLPEGIKVTFQQEDELFYEIKLTNGKTGWVTTESVEIIRI